MDSQQNTALRQFPSRTGGHYFNHAAISPWPLCSTEAVQQFAAENTLRGPLDYAQWISLEQKLREQLALLIGAPSARDIALLKNTTEGISTVAFGLHWKPGDNVILPQGEFPSNRLPWLAQAERGVEVREIEIREATTAEDALIAAMDQNTRLLAVSSVQWSDGFRLNLQQLGDACHKRGVLFFVDAIQQLGALQLDVTSCHISFLAADAHKWMLGPEGIAVFYSDPAVRPQLRLQQLGWHMVDNPWVFDRPEWKPSDTAKRFEAGSPNSLGQVALKASVDLLLAQGMDRVEQQVLHNTDYMMRQLQSIPDTRLLSNDALGRRSGIVTFRCEGVSANILQRALAVQRISCAVRDRAIRLSPHFYQGDADIDQVIAAIRRELAKL